MSRAKNWCFTLNNFTNDDIKRILDLGAEVDYIIFRKEVGDNVTPHLQGFVSFKSRVRRTTALQRVGQARLSVPRDVDQAMEYCKKDCDYIELGVRPRGPGVRSDLEDFKDAVIAGECNMSKLRLMYSDVVSKYPKFCTDFVLDHIPQKVVEPNRLLDRQQTLDDDPTLQPENEKVFSVVDLAANTVKRWFTR